MGPQNRGVLDINAIEAIGETVIPEPGPGLILMIAFLLAAELRRRK